jgi:DNA-binding NtrC family response regulator
VVHGIVKQHEGWINVYSEMGQGSIFKIYLPAWTEGMVEEGGEETRPTEWLEGQRERILVVEDDEQVLELIVDLLQENGYIVATASSAEEARATFHREQGNFDVFLSDVVLPDGNGVQLAEEFLALRPQMQVLLSSGYIDERARWGQIVERGWHFLQKPYSPDELLRVLREVLENR